MLLKGVCLRTLGYPYQALESLQQVLKQYVFVALNYNELQLEFGSPRSDWTLFQLHATMANNFHCYKLECQTIR